MASIEAIDTLSEVLTSTHEDAVRFANRLEERGFTVIGIDQSPLRTIGDAIQSINKTLKKQAELIKGVTGSG
jgi:pyruvate carboxylase